MILKSYIKTRESDIEEFTGISFPYEILINPSLTLQTESNLKDSVDKLLKYIELMISQKK